METITIKSKADHSTEIHSGARLLISEDSDKIRSFEYQISQAPEKLKAVIRAYGILGIERPLTINEIESLSGRADDIDDWLRSRIIDAGELPKIGAFVIQREKAKELLTLPAYSSLTASLKEVRNLDLLVSKFFEIEYAGENGRVPLIKIKTIEVQDEIERYRWYVSPANMKLYRELEFVVAFLNREIVEKSDIPAWSAEHRKYPGVFRPKLWENAKGIQEYFIFNYPLNRYEINVAHFKRLADVEKKVASKHQMPITVTL